MEKFMKILSFLVVLEDKTLPDPGLEAQGSPEGCPEGPWRLHRDPQGVPGKLQGVPKASLGARKVAQGRPKGRPKPPQRSQKHPQKWKIEAQTHPR